jgi:hypothetical protein
MHRRVGDFNGDGVTDVLDFVVFLNDSGVEGYDAADLVAWMKYDGESIWPPSLFNQSLSTAAALVPEPSSLILAIAACIGLYAPHRRRQAVLCQRSSLRTFPRSIT